MELEDECDLKLFDTYEPMVTSKGKAIDLLMNMQQLRYVNFDSDLGTVGFTASGLDWLKRNIDKMEYYVKLHGITLESFGAMGCYVEGLFRDMSDKGFLNLNEYSILDSKVKINEVGQVVVDMNEVVFTEKAEGDIEI